MKHLDLPLHLRGESLFLDDLPEPANLLHAAVFTAPIAHGEILSLDLEKAQRSKGTAGVFCWRDIPGENQVGGIIPDEPLMAEHEVSFMGETLALAAAETPALARLATQKIRASFREAPPILNPRDAFALGRLVAPPRTFSLGDTDSAWSLCDTITEGQADSGGQEHFYLETQNALAIPTENRGMKVYASTQAPAGVQRGVARVLGLPLNRVEVEVRRLGGGFGGKEDQATPWACLAALAAFRLQRPVKLLLNRHEDMAWTGKRHPYSADFKIGLTRDGRILAYQVMFYQNSGAAADLSTAILERTLFHTSNSYYIPHVRAAAACCYTHLPPFTAFRGFGAPQAMFVLEAAIHKAAQAMNLHPRIIQEKNLLREGDLFPYGMPAENCRARRCWQRADQLCDFQRRQEEAENFNATHRFIKKGIAIMPVCFGISFTNTTLNQAGALAHVYTDGSVNISSGAVEMGQGVNMKLRAVAARVFNIDPERISILPANTTHVANSSPTAASTGADLNGAAVELACLQILARLKQTAALMMGDPNPHSIQIRAGRFLQKEQDSGLTWEKVIAEAYKRRTDLSAHAFYATPGIFFDRSIEKGEPFAYHVYGTALTRVTVDCLRGTYDVDQVSIVHDAGRSLHPQIDRGQVEGGLIQGLGWMTMEELIYDEQGRQRAASAASYKVPDLKSTPEELHVHFLEDGYNPKAVMNSKAVGEPPFMYGIGVYFAIAEALKAFNPEKEMFYNAPLTPEKILLHLHS